MVKAHLICYMLYLTMDEDLRRKQISEVVIKIDSQEFIENMFATALKIDDYLAIVEAVQQTGFIADKDFQKKFNAFFRIRQRSNVWYEEYYKLLREQVKAKRPFECILKALYNVNGKIEVSFSSKLIAAVDPTRPIWDSNVLGKLGCAQEWDDVAKKTPAERIERAVQIYNCMDKAYDKFIASEEGRACIGKFDRILPRYKDKLSNVKKVDYILWGTK